MCVGGGCVGGGVKGEEDLYIHIHTQNCIQSSMFLLNHLCLTHRSPLPSTHTHTSPSTHTHTHTHTNMFDMNVFLYSNVPPVRHFNDPLQRHNSNERSIVLKMHHHLGLAEGREVTVGTVRDLFFILVDGGDS